MIKHNQIYPFPVLAAKRFFQALDIVNSMLISNLLIMLENYKKMQTINFYKSNQINMKKQLLCVLPGIFILPMSSFVQNYF